MNQARTPRQTPGEGLVPLTVMVTRATLTNLTTLALDDQRSLSQVARMAIEAYLESRAQARDASAG